MKFIRRKLQKGYTIVELIICMIGLAVIPLALFWGWVLVKFVLAAVGYMEANS